MREVKTKEELIKIIKEKKIPLHEIDVSEIENMSQLFKEIHAIEGDISNWDVSNVKYMAQMFFKSKLNPNISNWDVSNVTTMRQMFYESSFDGEIFSWEFQKNVEMLEMFVFNDEYANTWNKGRKLPTKTDDLSKWINLKRNDTQLIQSVREKKANKIWNENEKILEKFILDMSLDDDIKNDLEKEFIKYDYKIDSREVENYYNILLNSDNNNINSELEF